MDPSRGSNREIVGLAQIADEFKGGSYQRAIGTPPPGYRIYRIHLPAGFIPR